MNVFLISYISLAKDFWLNVMIQNSLKIRFYNFIMYIFDIFWNKYEICWNLFLFLYYFYSVKYMKFIYLFIKFVYLLEYYIFILFYIKYYFPIIPLFFLSYFSLIDKSLSLYHFLLHIIYFTLNQLI